MKKEIIFLVALIISMLAIGVLLGSVLEPLHVCKRKHMNVINDGRVVILPADSTDDGRPTFDVIISDENVMEHMYPEEIANSLNSGKWEYNEMLELKEKAE